MPQCDIIYIVHICHGAWTQEQQNVLVPSQHTIANNVIHSFQLLSSQIEAALLNQIGSNNHYIDQI